MSEVREVPLVGGPFHGEYRRLPFPLPSDFVLAAAPVLDDKTVAEIAEHYLHKTPIESQIPPQKYHYRYDGEVLKYEKTVVGEYSYVEKGFRGT